MTQGSFVRLAFRRFRKHKLAVVSAVFLLLLSIAAILAPQIAPCDPYRMDVSNMEQGPSRAHLLGTDQIGRDILSRIIFASRVSLAVGLITAFVSTCIGTALGAISGYFGGLVDNVIMRMADIFMSFPMLPIAIVIVAVVGPSANNVVIIAALLSWPGLARIVRGQFLALREQDYAQAARAIGAGPYRIAFRHLLPNSLAPIVVWATLNVAQVILLEAGLSFLGLGVQIPTATWGNMLMDAQSIRVIEAFPWIWLPPGVMILLTVLSINLLGDGLRDALDPSLTR